jgi:hypothetical protein
MPLETTVEYSASTFRRDTRLERTCIVFLQSEIDIAIGFIHLADVETASGNPAHADELIAKASSSYKSVLKGLPTVPLDFEEERQGLREGARMLEDKIRAVARRRRDSNLH